MKYLRYKGEFLSVTGVVWRAEIHQEADAPYSTVGALEFDADQPLVIEWAGKSKEEVICGSVATLKIISPGDRTYEDLYSIDVGRVRLDVYRNGELYWSGCIDTEFYEEPYEQASGYTVTLTFSDLGVMDRLKYDLAGMQTLEALVSYCVGRCGINYGGIDDSLISTQLDKDSEPMTLADLKVRSDNFYDEDGEASTLEEVIKGVLQPLALRMVQRGGKIYVYDLHGLYTKGHGNTIVWSGSSQTMGVDVVYNNAKITWNTYAQSGNLHPDECWDESIETPANAICLNDTHGAQMGGAAYYSFHYENKDIKKWVDATDAGFTFWTTPQGKNAEILSEYARFFKIVPQYDGTESEGVALRWTPVAAWKVGSGKNWYAEYSALPMGLSVGRLSGHPSEIGSPIFRSTPVWIPPVENASDLLVRVSLEMLMDPRFNPFESAEDTDIIDFKARYDNWQSHGNYVYAPVRIIFQPDGGDAVYVWDNRFVVWKDNYRYDATSLAETYGTWASAENYDSVTAWGWIAYYDAKDRKGTSGVCGWKKNRPAINPHTSATLSILTNAEDGQYIPYPNFGGGGGKLWVEVCDGNWQINDGGTAIHDGNDGINTGGQLPPGYEINNPKGLWDKFNWLLFKLPEIEIMNSSQFDKAINTDDVEYSAELNGGAKDPIELDAICGTKAGGVPTARGAYFDTATGKQITQLTRAGRTTQAEDLLIGTLYSQYAQRRTKLSGEAELLSDPIVLYWEDNQDLKLFMAVEDVQDLRMDCSDATFVEIRPDEYKRNNE